MKKILFFIALLGTIALIAYGQNQKASDQGVATGTVIPTGTVMAFAGANAPSGWVFAYGQEQSQTNATYKNLYAVIGTAYCVAGHGAGACGGGNFRIPDYRGRALAGKENMGGSNPSPRRLQTNLDGTTISNTGGSEAYTPAGSVPASGLTSTTPAHYHLGNRDQFNITGSGAHGHSFSITRTNGVFSYGPAYVTSSSSDGSNNTTTTDTHAHSWTGTFQAGPSGTSGDSSITGTSVSGTAIISGTPGNNLPPMAVVNYIIKL